MFIWSNIVLPLLSAFGGACIGVISSHWLYAKQRQTEKHSILMGIAGEVEGLKGSLEKELRTVKEAERQGGTLKQYSFYYPCEFFSEILSELGKLDNVHLVKKIILLYANVKRLAEHARRLDENVYTKGQSSHSKYRQDIEKVFALASRTLLGLGPYVDKFPDEKWETKTPEWFVNDQNLLKEEPSDFKGEA